MINFSCGNCNNSIGAPDKYAGKRVRCPKCQEPTRVPESAVESPAEKPALIKFRCPGCNQKIGLSLEYAGKRVKCAKCEKILRVPQPAGKAPEPEGKKDTEPSVTAQQEPSASDDLWAGLENMEALLSAEAQAPSLEMPDRPPVPDYGAGESEFAQFPGGTSQYDSSSRRTVAAGSSKMKMFGAIFVGVCLLVAVVAGIVLYTGIAAVFKAEEQRKLTIPRVQEVAENYIRLMEKGEIDKASQLLNPDLKAEVTKEQLEEIAKKIGDSNIVRLECNMSHSQEHPLGNQFFLFYNLQYEQGFQFITMSMLEINDEFTIQGIGLRDQNSNTFALGPQSYEELSMIAVGETLKGVFSVIVRFFCGIAIIIIVLGLIQIVSMWIIFEKTGHPGWAAIVPFYNMWVLALVADQSGWVGLGACFGGGVPVIGPIIQIGLWLVLSLGVAKTFNRGVLFGIGLLILPFIFFPILAFTGD